jgi:enamine deaminase RidA (YjgF/YER057c/UK114 family)
MVFLPRLPGSIKAEITLVAARNGDVLYTRAESAEDAGPGFEKQYRAVLGRQAATLYAAGLGWADVTDVQVYLTDLANMESLDNIFRETFPRDPPARTTIQVHPKGEQQVQSSLVAVKKNSTR